MATQHLLTATEARPDGRATGRVEAAPNVSRHRYSLATAREMSAAEMDAQRRLVLASLLPRGA
jgi:hypothetical protein